MRTRAPTSDTRHTIPLHTMNKLPQILGNPAKMYVANPCTPKQSKASEKLELMSPAFDLRLERKSLSSAVTEDYVEEELIITVEPSLDDDPYDVEADDFALEQISTLLNEVFGV